MLDKILRKKIQQDALMSNLNDKENKFTLGNILWQGGLESLRHSVVTLFKLLSYLHCLFSMGPTEYSNPATLT